MASQNGNTQLILHLQSQQKEQQKEIVNLPQKEHTYMKIGAVIGTSSGTLAGYKAFGYLAELGVLLILDISCCGIITVSGIVLGCYFGDKKDTKIVEEKQIKYVFKEAEKLFGVQDYKQKDDDEDYTLEELEQIYRNYEIFANPNKFKTQNSKEIAIRRLQKMKEAMEVIKKEKGWIQQMINQ